jgi:MFS family permease
VNDLRRFSVLRGSLRPLSFHNYLLFWIGFVASNTGRWIEMTGSLWLVSELTDSPVLLGGIGLARAVPAILLSPVAGVVADRVDQRRLLLLTQATSLLLSFSLGVLILTGAVQVWMIYLQLSVQSCVQPFDLAGRQTLFPRLVPRSELSNAVTLTVTAARLAKFIGPVIAGVALAALGEAAPYLLNTVSFLALMLAVLAMRDIPPLLVRATQTFSADLREGVDEIRRTPLVSGIVQLEAVFGLLQVNQVMITIVARDVLGVGPEGLGMLLAAPALGAMTGMLTLVMFGTTRRQGRFATVSVAAYAAMMLVIANSLVFTLTFVALATTGLLDSWVTVARLSILQLSVPPTVRGRVVANVAVVSSGVSSISQLQTGVLTAILGILPAIVGSAVALTAISTILAFRNRTLWRFESARDGPAEG